MLDSLHRRVSQLFTAGMTSWFFQKQESPSNQKCLEQSFLSHDMRNWWWCPFTRECWSSSGFLEEGSFSLHILSALSSNYLLKLLSANYWWRNSAERKTPFSTCHISESFFRKGCKNIRNSLKQNKSANPFKAEKAARRGNSSWRGPTEYQGKGVHTAAAERSADRRSGDVQTLSKHRQDFPSPALSFFLSSDWRYLNNSEHTVSSSCHIVTVRPVLPAHNIWFHHHRHICAPDGRLMTWWQRCIMELLHWLQLVHNFGGDTTPPSLSKELTSKQLAFTEVKKKRTSCNLRG